ncbi:uncharacterized protein [Cherax quadricarinatus]|uniref:uncharacterized protein n=1 Tax=Cherax quadricarinatus TaxID=27406 RepID=UPI00387E2AB5
MRVSVIVCVILAIISTTDSIVAPGSGAPGFLISYLLLLTEITLGVVLFKKFLHDTTPAPVITTTTEPLIMTLTPPAENDSSDVPEEVFMRRRYKRAILTGVEKLDEAHRILLSTINLLDKDRCMLKLLCHVHNKQLHVRSPKENIFLQQFSYNTEMMSSYHADILEAAEVVGQANCNKVFPKCSLSSEELNSQLHQTRTCSSFHF